MINLATNLLTIFNTAISNAVLFFNLMVARDTTQQVSRDKGTWSPEAREARAEWNYFLALYLDQAPGALLRNPYGSRI